MLRGMGAGFRHRDGNGRIVPGPALPPDPAADMATLVGLMARLVDHFVLPNFLQKTVINLASGASQRIDSVTNPVASIIVNVTTGKLDLWWSDMTGVAAGTIPDLEFTPIGAPVQIVLPPRPYIFTVVANGALTQGTFTMSSA